MSSDVYLMRHGEAEPRASTDSKRQLTERGRLQVRNNLAKLPQNKPIALFHSPYVRALQSAEILQQSLQLSALHCVSWLEPETPVLDVVAEMLLLPPAETMLMVSHNPLLDALVAELAAVPLGTFTFATGTLHRVHVDLVRS